MLNPSRLIPCSLALLSLIQPSLVLSAETDWSQCAVPVVTREETINYDLFATEVTANQVDARNQQQLIFRGDVELLRQDQRILADWLELNEPDGSLRASGQVQYTDPLFRLETETLDFSDQTQSGKFGEARFQLLDSHLNGSAENIFRVDENLSVFKDVRYTTCDPGQNTWSMGANRLTINQQTGRGTATHAVMRIQDVPVFYFPWIMFPIDDRRMSGLLTPTFSIKDNNIDNYRLPVYWNIAPNTDMTITPAWYRDHGNQLNTENRYLLGDHAGQLDLSNTDDNNFEESRWFQRWQHQARLFERIDLAIQIQEASDTEYFDDFEGGNLPSDDIDYLKSLVSFSTVAAGWSTQMLFEEYQTINLDKAPSSRPYKRLPQISANRLFQQDQGNWQLQWDNQWVEFEREDSIVGQRLHISPKISYTFEDSWFFSKPMLQLDYTRYDLDNNTDDINSIERSLPLFSIDNGLIFERLASSSNHWVQTLEPRLFLLSVPFEDQSDIPDFDTALLAENYNNLFLNNRFSGADRVGDTRQATLGIRTRLIDMDSGRELFNAGIAQAFYDKPREVSLNNSIDERERSNIATQINLSPWSGLTFSASNIYDETVKESIQNDIALRHRQGAQVFNLEYHSKNDSLEQSTLSFVYPINNQWVGFGKRQYSLLHEKPVQNLVGLAYESCCWGIKILYEKASDNDFENTDSAIYVEFVFKGLSSAGKDIDSILEDGILGYQSDF